MAYQAQVVTWHTSNPHIRPDKQHQYPLTPGKPAAGSRECWGCGIPGHSKGAPACAGATLPEPESDWRRIASYIVRTYHQERQDIQPVNFVGYVPYTPYPEYSQFYEGEIDDSQGNDQGLSA